MGRSLHIAEKTPEQLQARDLFVKKGMNPTQIAGVLARGATTSTVYRWSKKFGWERERMAWLSLPFSVAEDLRNQLKRIPQIYQEAKTPQDLQSVSDALTKTVSAISKLDDESNRLGAVLWAVGKMQIYLAHELKRGAISVEFSGDLAAFLDRFGVYMTEART